MLIITGTQRAGTTLVASLFAGEGYYLGNTNNDEVGGFENQIICSFYRDYLGDDSFPYEGFPHDRPAITGSQQPFTHIAGSFAYLDLPVIKFSYLCMNPAFVSIWHKFRPEEAYHDQFLILRRDPSHVVWSKKIKRDVFDMDSPLIKQTSASIDNNFMMSTSLLQHLGYRSVIVPFENLISDFVINNYLSLLDIDIRIPRATWDRIFDIDRIHFK